MKQNLAISAVLATLSLTLAACDRPSPTVVAVPGPTVAVPGPTVVDPGLPDHATPETPFRWIAFDELSSLEFPEANRTVVDQLMK